MLTIRIHHPGLLMYKCDYIMFYVNSNALGSRDLASQPLTYVSLIGVIGSSIDEYSNEGTDGLTIVAKWSGRCSL